MILWCVYYKPKDWPHGYIARRHDIYPGESRATEEVIKADSLESLRRLLPEGLVCIARHPDDEPQIVEVWL